MISIVEKVALSGSKVCGVNKVSVKVRGARCWFSRKQSMVVDQIKLV